MKKRIASALFEKGHLNSASCLHALNLEELDHIRRFGIKQPVAVIPNGVNPQKVSIDVPAPWVDAFGHDAKVMLFLGRLHPKKNLHGLISAMSKVKQRAGLNEWRVAIAGWGDANYVGELQQVVSANGLSEDVYFTGPVFGDKKAAALAQAAGFVLPSFSEGLPMAVLEAWSHGCPVAISRECNLSESFEKGAAFELRLSPTELASDLIEFLHLKERELRKIGVMGAKVANEKYSWESVLRSYVELYDWMLGEGEQPDFVEA